MKLTTNELQIIERLLSNRLNADFEPDVDELLHKIRKEISEKILLPDLQEIQKYREIGTVEECREARERQIPKKPVLYKGTNGADCPVCGNTVRGISKPFGEWCSHCGNKLDWSE